MMLVMHELGRLTEKVVAFEHAPPVTFTLYVVFVVGEMVITEVVAPVLHE